MAAYSDQEQVDAVKKWWVDNGRSIIAGAVIGFAALFGWRGWVAYQENQAEEASLLYADFRELAAGGEIPAVAEQSERFQEDFAGTPYAALAALELAKLKVQAGELEAAAAELRWVVENGSQAALRDVARLRLARVLTTLEQPEEALSVLNHDFPAGYAALVEEAKGDVLRTRGDLDAARAAYDRAIAESQGDIRYLRMKRNDLGDIPPSGPS